MIGLKISRSLLILHSIIGIVDDCELKSDTIRSMTINISVNHHLYFLN